MAYGGDAPDQPVEDSSDVTVRLADQFMPSESGLTLEVIEHLALVSRAASKFIQKIVNPISQFYSFDDVMKTS